MGRKVLTSTTHRQIFKFSMRRFEIQERYWEAMIGNRVVPQVPVQPCTVQVHCGRQPKVSESYLQQQPSGLWTHLRCKRLLGHSILHMILSSSLIWLHVQATVALISCCCDVCTDFVLGRHPDSPIQYHGVVMTTPFFVYPQADRPTHDCPEGEIAVHTDTLGRVRAHRRSPAPLRRDRGTTKLARVWERRRLSSQHRDRRPNHGSRRLGRTEACQPCQRDTAHAQGRSQCRLAQVKLERPTVKARRQQSLPPRCVRWPGGAPPCLTLVWAASSFQLSCSSLLSSARSRSGVPFTPATVFFWRRRIQVDVLPRERYF